MRHRKFGKRLNRPMAHRKAVMDNLAKYIVMHGRIVTTITKAKMLRGVIEPLITIAKKGTISGMRQAMSVFRSRDLVKKLFTEIAPLYKERNGGYTRILKYYNRAGDNAPMAIIELIGSEAIYKKEDKKEKKEKKEKAEKGKEVKEEKKEKKEKKEEKKPEKKEDKKAKK